MNSDLGDRLPPEDKDNRVGNKVKGSKASKIRTGSTDSKGKAGIPTRVKVNTAVILSRGTVDRRNMANTRVSNTATRVKVNLSLPNNKRSSLNNERSSHRTLAKCKDSNLPTSAAAAAAHLHPSPFLARSISARHQKSLLL